MPPTVLAVKWAPTHALICAAPELLRARFREQSRRGIINTAAKLRISTGWDVETRTYARVLRDLARRHHVLRAEAKAHETAITAIVKKWRPDLLAQFGVGPIVAATVLCAWSHPGRCRNEAAFANLAGVAPSPRTQASPTNIASVGSETGTSTERCTSLSCTDSATTPARRPTPTAAEPHRRPTVTSSAALSATSRGNSSDNSKIRLDDQ